MLSVNISPSLYSIHYLPFVNVSYSLKPAVYISSHAHLCKLLHHLGRARCQEEEQIKNSSNSPDGQCWGWLKEEVYRQENMNTCSR